MLENKEIDIGHLVECDSGTCYRILDISNNLVSMRNTEHSGGVTITRKCSLGILYKLKEKEVKEPAMTTLF